MSNEEISEENRAFVVETSEVVSVKLFRLPRAAKFESPLNSYYSCSWKP